MSDTSFGLGRRILRRWTEVCRYTGTAFGFRRSGEAAMAMRVNEPSAEPVSCVRCAKSEAGPAQLMSWSCGRGCHGVAWLCAACTRDEIHGIETGLGTSH